MRGKKLLGCSEVDLGNALGSAPGKQLLQQTPGYAVFPAAELLRDEHLAQRCLLVSDIEQADRSGDSPATLCDPEIPTALLIEAPDITQVRLIFECYVDAELDTLNRDDDTGNVPRVVRMERADVQ